MGFGMDEMSGNVTGIPGFDEYTYDCQVQAQDSNAWIDKNQNVIPYSKMNNQYLRNAARTARLWAATASDSHDEARFNAWADQMDLEVHIRMLCAGDRANQNEKKITKAVQKAAKKPTRGKKVQQQCPCGNKFEARAADVKRGWGKYCSKSCKGRFGK